MAKILVADDMKGITNAVTRVLTSDGHEVDICENGVEAIIKLKENRYDLVITDILMPEKDGLEVAKYIRKELPEDRRNTPILAITGGGTLVSSEMAIEAARLHTDAVLQKPFDIQTFRNAVNNFLSGNEAVA